MVKIVQALMGEGDCVSTGLGGGVLGGPDDGGGLLLRWSLWRRRDVLSDGDGRPLATGKPPEDRITAWPP